MPDGSTRPITRLLSNDIDYKIPDSYIKQEETDE